MRLSTQSPALWVLLGLGTAAQAQDPGAEGDFKGIKALLETQVESATKVARPLSEAPGAITVITASDIQESGARTLADLLKRVPGVQIGDNRANVLMVWIRGITTTYNERVLLLIDGVPKRDATLSEWAPDERFDLQGVDRIEFIRGPGSALHGGNALGGVISIHTRDDPSYQRLSVTAGQEGTAELNLRGGAVREGLTLNYSGRAFKTDGYESERGLKGAPSNNTNARASRNFQVGGALDGGFGFTLNGADFDYRYPMHEIYNARDARYTYSLGSMFHRLEGRWGSWVNRFYFDHTRIRFHETVVNPDGSIKQVKDQDKQGLVLGIDSQVTWDLTQAHTLVAGMNGEKNKATYSEEEWNPDSTNPVHPTYLFNSWLSQHGEGPGRNIARTVNYSAFTQDESRFFDRQLILTAGVRFDRFEGFGNQLSPRLGVVLLPRDGTALKLLWGDAFRPPTFRQLYVVRFDGFQPGNPNLKPERSNTLEMEASQRLGRSSNVKLGAFITTLRDTSVTIADGPWQTSPIPRKIQGLEGEFRSELSFDSTWLLTGSFFVNGAYLLKAYDDTPLGSVNIASVAPWTGNMGVTLRTAHLTLFSAWNWVGRRNAGYVYNPAINQVVYTYHSSIAPAYQVWKDKDNKGGYVVQDLDLAWVPASHNTLRLDLKVKNLWNTRYYNPTHDPDTYYDVLGQQRMAELRLSLRF